MTPTPPEEFLAGGPAAPRIAGADDLEPITATIAAAFAQDPVWGPAMGGTGTSTAAKARIWRILVSGALRYSWSAIVGDGAAVSIWIPPHGTELSDEQTAELGATLRDVLEPAGLDAFHALLDRFDANHRHDEPHAYLSLLATHPDRRGHGLGMALLRDDLRRLDELHLAAWLESTNPANDARYRSVGFEPVGSFRTIDEERVITTMWRPRR